MFRLDNKNAVITGGGSGIGRATALVFARQGARVHIIDTNKEAADSTIDEIKEQGGSGEAHTCDVTQQIEVKTLFGSLGRIDILVNSAGISHIGNVESTTEEDFDRVCNINVKGVFNTLRSAIPVMKEQNDGVIVNLASVASSVGISDRFAYSMSKGAVLAMTLSVARDYVAQNIRCNSISPARVHTPFVDGFLKKNYAGREEEMFQKLSRTQPIGRMAKPEEVASFILYLCSEEASFITGCDYPIDGGFIKLNN